MNTTTRRTTTIFAAATALALTAGLATPSLAEGGDGAGWRYDQYLAKEAAQRQASAEARQTDRQKAATGATEFEDTGSEHRTQRNGGQRFYFDVPGWEEDSHRGR